MPSIPSRESLENLKRADLQRLCKDHGVKANLKSEALIDLLLDAQKPTILSTRRSVSTRMSSRSGPSHTKSVIIHDKDDKRQDQELNDDHLCGHESDTPTAAASKPNTPPVTRARKAKEHTGLGVGRPTAARGLGPRVMTKSSSLSKSRRAKASKTMTPPGDTIPEEDQEHESPTESTQEMDNPPPKAVSDNITQAHVEQACAHASSGEETLASLATIDKHVADALRPLHEQMKSLKSELELMQSLRAEIGQLKTQVAEIGTLKEKVESLTGELQDLRMQATPTTPLASEPELSKSGSLAPFKPAPPSSSGHFTRQGSSGPGISHSTDSTGPQTSYDSGAATSNHPGIAPVMLGKRQRDTPGSNMASMMEELDDELSGDDPGKKPLRPARKRVKVSTPDDMTAEANLMVPGSGHSQVDEQEEAPASNVAKFTVFRGPGEYSDMNVDPPPPNNPLPDLFRPPSTGAGPSYARLRATGTSSAHASENQQPFNFSFPAISSTPTHDLFMPSFPYPEPPQSPSPAGINPSGFFRGGERADIFQQFGFPNPSRPLRSRLGHVAGRFVNPALLTRRIPDGDPEEPPHSNTGNEMAMSPPEPGPSSSTGMEVVADVPLMKRTMYGTELDGDTRFGDFGVEGVGGNGTFWADGRY